MNTLSPPGVAWARSILVLILAMVTVGCDMIADGIQEAANKVGPSPKVPSANAQAFHRSLFVADLHADTLLWRRGLAFENPYGQVDLGRMVRGNLALQMLTIATRVPTGMGCIDGSNFDPAPALAAINGWPRPTWNSAHERAAYQARRLREVLARLREERIGVTLIKNSDDLAIWLKDRYRTGGPDPNRVAVMLGAEGAHAFDDPDGPEFELLFFLGLRMVAPTHRFDNSYGGSSEGCIRGGLTTKGTRLVNVAIERHMIVDLAHSSGPTFSEAIEILENSRHPAIISHSGLRSYLDTKGEGTSHRANSDEELIRLAQTGGVFGVGFWPAAIGDADVRDVVGTILRAIQILRSVEGVAPHWGGFHIVRDATEHVALGSDWDGAVKVAIDPSHLAAITEMLLQHLKADEVANIMGLNTCRVIAHSLGAADFVKARDVCTSGIGPSYPLVRPEGFGDADRRP